MAANFKGHTRIQWSNRVKLDGRNQIRGMSVSSFSGPSLGLVEARARVRHRGRQSGAGSDKKKGGWSVGSWRLDLSGHERAARGRAFPPGVGGCASVLGPRSTDWVFSSDRVCLVPELRESGVPVSRAFEAILTVQAQRPFGVDLCQVMGRH